LLMPLWYTREFAPKINDIMKLTSYTKHFKKKESVIYIKNKLLK
jgi:hypothetical protein